MPLSTKVLCEKCRLALLKKGKDRYKRRKQAGLCNCGRVPEDGFASCSSCRTRSNQYVAQNKVRLYAARRECYYKNHEAALMKRKRVAENLRNEVLVAYGSCCACCKEQRKEFLQVDHIDGDGANHRREVGSYIYHWLRKHNYPNKFRLLCANCNWARGIYGYCPHEQE